MLRTYNSYYRESRTVGHSGTLGPNPGLPHTLIHSTADKCTLGLAQSRGTASYIYTEITMSKI